MNINRNKIDAELVLDFQSGNKKALVSLVKRWHKIFCKKAFWIVKDVDVSKDIAQESWTVIINKIESLNDPSRFGSWALRIVYNKSFDWIREKKKARILAEDLKYEQDLFTEEKHGAIEVKKRELLKTIKGLPKNQEDVIRLFYLNDYSLNEISSLLGISVGTTKSRLFYARERLKKILKTKFNN